MSDGTKTKAHRILFQANTFKPSNIPIGKILKNAIHALKAMLRRTIVEMEGGNDGT